MSEYTELQQKGTHIRVEVVAGITTFLTMAYIIFVNPAILAGGAGMDQQGVIAATCLASAIGTLMVGLIANAPIAMAPGMGLNAFFVSLVMSGKMDWQTALGAVFVSGLLFFMLTLLGLRKKIVEAIPPALISAIAVGIGLFITFMGLMKLGVIVDHPQTLVTAGPLTPKVLMGLAGLMVMLIFEMRKMTGGLLVGILVSTLLGVLFDKDVTLPAQWISLDMPLRSVAGQLNILGTLKWGVAGSVFTLMFIDMFDSVGTLMACCHQAGRVDQEGNIKGLDRLLGIDAVATMAGALLGTSTTTSYIESAAGIEQGGRTGLTSIVTGLLFLLAIVFIPVIGIVPDYATAPALIMVGLFMMNEVKRIHFSHIEEAFPAFIIMVMIALSYSISMGLACGFVSFVVMKVFAGRTLQVKPAMWVIASLSLLFLTIDMETFTRALTEDSSRLGSVMPWFFTIIACCWLAHCTWLATHGPGLCILGAVAGGLLFVGFHWIILQVFGSLGLDLVPDTGFMLHLYIAVEIGIVFLGLLIYKILSR